MPFVGIKDISASNWNKLVGRCQSRSIVNVDRPAAGSNTAIDIFDDRTGSSNASRISNDIVQHIFYRTHSFAVTQVNMRWMYTLLCQTNELNGNREILALRIPFQISISIGCVL